jgi:xanthine dehydrogenase accessory factor
MKEFLSEINGWLSEKKTFAVATVIQTWGSAPRPVGSCMLVSADMEMIGSVSGGCVEGSVVREAIEVLKTDTPKLLSYGITDEEAWEVGLSCGGAIKVFVEKFMSQNTENDLKNWDILNSIFQNEIPTQSELRSCLTDNKGATLLIHLNGQNSQHVLVQSNNDFHDETVSETLISEAQRAYSERKSQVIELGEDKWFAQVFSSKERLIIVGAAHITVDLVHLAHYFGFETVVIDPRGIFADKTQFSTPPDNLFNDWPAEVLPDMTLDENTFAVMLTHDPKIDDQALEILLKSKVAYIGALGSKKTHEKRVKRLIEKGFSEAEIARIHAPIGVDIRAKSAREIALSIVAELIKEKNKFL